MQILKEIGGYFELESNNRTHFIHDEGILLNTCRNAFEYLIISLGSVKRVWIPYYTCEVMLEPLKRLNINYSFYHINHLLEINEEIILNDGEYILYTNYFGVKDSYVAKLSNIYKERVIIDNAQALYSPRMQYSSQIYSPRKYVGLPDGGIAYMPEGFEAAMVNFDFDKSYDRCSHLLKRCDETASSGYSDFVCNDAKLINLPILQMSHLTRALMSNIDFDDVKLKRVHNFKTLHNALRDTNKLLLDEFGGGGCPMVYPYLCDDDTLRNKLIANKIFVAKYWPNVEKWCGKDGFETYLMNNLIPLPIDQRYGAEEMKRIINVIV